MDEERNFTIEPEDEPPAQSEYTQPDYIPEWTQPTQPEEPEEPKKKRRTWLKITALLLALAIVASLGRALLRSAINGLAAHNASGDSAQPAADASGAASAPESAGEPYQRELTPLPETLPTYDSGKTLTAQEVYQTVKDAVVTVAVDLGGGKMSVGTGILFREDGYFVTNQHVVAGGSACTVLLADGTPYEANYIASDADYDVAVLKIDGTGFPTADFGNSDTLEVGETVYAIGTPLNLEMGGTFTDGIVSSVNREMQQTAGTSMPLIQTNAALNNGNSGGPLINSCGQVVGINFMKMYARASTVEGLGFAIPSVQVERVVNDLLTYGAVQPEPVLGLMVRQLPDQLADKLWGIRVESVTPGGAAERAGIQEGDYVLAADDRETLSSSDVLKARWQHHVGDTMTMTIWRDGEIFTVTLELKQAVQN